MAQEAAGGGPGVDVPQAQGAVPGAGQAELAVGGDDNVLQGGEGGEGERGGAGRQAGGAQGGGREWAGGSKVGRVGVVPRCGRQAEGHAAVAAPQLVVLPMLPWMDAGRAAWRCAAPPPHLDVVGVAAQGALGVAHGAVLGAAQLPDHDGLVAAGKDRHRRGGRGWMSGGCRGGVPAGCMGRAWRCEIQACCSPLPCLLLTGWRTAAHRRWGPGARRWRSPSPCGLRGAAAAGRGTQVRGSWKRSAAGRTRKCRGAADGRHQTEERLEPSRLQAGRRTEELAAESESLQGGGRGKARCGGVSQEGSGGRQAGGRVGPHRPAPQRAAAPLLPPRRRQQHCGQQARLGSRHSHRPASEACGQRHQGPAAAEPRSA